MVQFEVAERFCALPGTSSYGSLSVWVSARAQGRILRKIGPEHFTPRPNVDSATVLLTPLADPLEAPAAFYDFVRAGFSQKRKRLANSLSGTIEKTKVLAALERLGLSENTRAEELSPQRFLDLYKIIQE